MKRASMNRGIVSAWLPLLALVAGIAFGVVARNATHDDSSGWPSVEAVTPGVNGDVIDPVVSPPAADGAQRRSALVQT
jgi:hypothetical protein